MLLAFVHSPCHLDDVDGNKPQTRASSSLKPCSPTTSVCIDNILVTISLMSLCLFFFPFIFSFGLIMLATSYLFMLYVTFVLFYLLVCLNTTATTHPLCRFQWSVEFVLVATVSLSCLSVRSYLCICQQFPRSFVPVIVSLELYLHPCI